MRTLIWFRRDLRIIDNSALFNAAKHSSDGVVALFVITPLQWKQHDDADCKVSFWIENLRSLSASLARLNIPLLIKTCDTFGEAPAVVLKTAKKHRCSALSFNREYEVNELDRDSEMVRLCRANDIVVQQFHDRVIVPPKEIETKQGKFYSVFTPYRKVWNTKAIEYSQPVGKPSKQPDVGVKPSPIPKSVAGFDFTNDFRDCYPAGEAEAAKRLKHFASKISDYDQARDIPSLEGTSELSAYLAAGVISPRQCMAAALKAKGGEIDGGNQGATIWISELTWRDFYAHVMVGFPRVSKHKPFKLKTESIPWRDSESDLMAWKTGQTGYPIVDAGMRQLNQTGWMHNRLRMVTAMFLTKNLLIDWRLGEKYFMENLIDGDLAANNGGWQWSASTGTDAVPYFRIFNPFSQSKRFDPDGEFIKQMCPELESVPAKSLHDPKKLSNAIEELGIEYPDFVVEYSAGRQRALDAFKTNA